MSTPTLAGTPDPDDTHPITDTPARNRTASSTSLVTDRPSSRSP